MPALIAVTFLLENERETTAQTPMPVESSIDR